MNNILQVNNLTVKYGRSEVLTNVSFEIDKGDYVGIVGPNGSGKTTLIKAILGLIPIYTAVQYSTLIKIKPYRLSATKSDIK